MDDAEKKKAKALKKYAKISSDYRQNCQGMTDEALQQEIFNVALQELEQKMKIEMDPAINSLKELLKDKLDPEREVLNIIKLKIPFIVGLLEGRGRDVPSYESFLKKAAKSLLDKTNG